MSGRSARQFWPVRLGCACVVRNITSLGALVAVLPIVFELTFDSARTLRFCRIAWRTRTKVGVEFCARRTSPDFRRESCFMGASNSCQLARLFAWDWQPIQSQRVRSAMIRCSCLEAGIAGAMTDLNTVWTRFGPASSPLSGEADMDRQVKPAGTVANDRAAKLAAIPAGESPANRDAMGRRRGYCIHRR